MLSSQAGRQSRINSAIAGTSLPRICRSSGRGWMVMPSAPASWASRANSSRSGTPVRRELRSNAILLRLTLGPSHGPTLVLHRETLYNRENPAEEQTPWRSCSAPMGIATRVHDGWAKLPPGMEFNADVAAVGVDKDDNVYAFNRGKHPMCVFDRDGNLLRTWGEEGVPAPARCVHASARWHDLVDR